ncbi:MAG: hypothetical protein LBJ14_04625 [Desulfarculales bacterium]|nr:hypothetical protein [Desulfarculales bacterium]
MAELIFPALLASQPLFSSAKKGRQVKLKPVPFLPGLGGLIHPVKITWRKSEYFVIRNIRHPLRNYYFAYGAIDKQIFLNKPPSGFINAMDAQKVSVIGVQRSPG